MTVTASDYSIAKADISGAWNALSGITITTSANSEADVEISGGENTISGLTLTNSGTSLTQLTMPSSGFSDTGRSVVGMLAS